MENCVALSSLLSVSSLSLPTSRCPGSLASVRGLLPLRALSLALSDRLSSLTLRHRAKLLSISSSDRADDALVRVICSRRAWALIPAVTVSFSLAVISSRSTFLRISNLRTKPSLGFHKDCNMSGFSHSPTARKHSLFHWWSSSRRPITSHST